jgi:hypothetical protein
MLALAQYNDFILHPATFDSGNVDGAECRQPLRRQEKLASKQYLAALRAWSDSVSQRGE